MAARVNLGWIALDVGARRHAFAAMIDGREEAGEVENTPEAILRFLNARQARCGRLRVLMEATGIYYLDLALLAIEAGVEVMVVNPKAAHHFARACNARSKTDALDAKLLLHYLQRMPFQPWCPPSSSALALRQYGRHLSQLSEQCTMTRNRLHALISTRTSPLALREDLRGAIAGLEARIRRLSGEALALIRADVRLNAQFEALDSIIGVGEASALALLGELLVLPSHLSSRACVCHAGLDVRVHQSGTSIALAPRLSKHGNKHLRRALYMPALTAIRHDPGARAFRDRLLGRGKRKMQAIAAIMRKLLTAAWALVRNPDVYDSRRLFADC